MRDSWWNSWEDARGFNTWAARTYRWVRDLFCSDYLFWWPMPNASKPTMPPHNRQLTFCLRKEPIGS